MKSNLRRSLVVGLMVLAGGVATAQDSKPAPTKPAPVPAPAPALPEKPKPPQPAWTDAELGKIGDMLTGTWKTETPVQAVGGGTSVDIVMAVIPVAIDGLPNALYVESARADAMQLPYRQSILQLYHSKGKIRMRTLDPHSITAQNAIGAHPMLMDIVRSSTCTGLAPLPTPKAAAMARVVAPAAATIQTATRTNDGCPVTTATGRSAVSLRMRPLKPPARTE